MKDACFPCARGIKYLACCGRLNIDFLKVATTLVDLLCIELMLHLSHVKQMYSQPVQLSNELRLLKQLKKGRVDFSGYLAVIFSLSV